MTPPVEIPIITALADLPALSHLARLGLLRPPRFLPPWAADLRFLMAYLSYSAFLNRIDLGHLGRHTQRLLDETPQVDWGPAAGG